MEFTGSREKSKSLSGVLETADEEDTPINDTTSSAEPEFTIGEGAAQMTIRETDEGQNTGNNEQTMEIIDMTGS